MLQSAKFIRYFLYEDEEVVQLLAVELDGCCGDDVVDVLDDGGGLARLQTKERTVKEVN